MLWEETHVLKVVGSNPGTVFWMDIFSHLFVVKIVMMFVWKRPKINEKEAGVGPFLKTACKSPSNSLANVTESKQSQELNFLFEKANVFNPENNNLFNSGKTQLVRISWRMGLVKVRTFAALVPVKIKNLINYSKAPLMTLSRCRRRRRRYRRHRRCCWSFWCWKSWMPWS